MIAFHFQLPPRLLRVSPSPPGLVQLRRYESVLMISKLLLWATLVLFDHGSEMQLATALVVNVLQLCLHLMVLPMGGDGAVLLNRMQAATLVLTT